MRFANSFRSDLMIVNCTATCNLHCDRDCRQHTRAYMQLRLRIASSQGVTGVTTSMVPNRSLSFVYLMVQEENLSISAMSLYNLIVGPQSHPLHEIIIKARKITLW